MRPNNESLRVLRKAIENELGLADFDPEQTQIRLGRLIDDYDDDLMRWRRDRIFFKKNKELLKRAKGGAPAG
jgi:hypothetical protein